MWPGRSDGIYLTHADRAVLFALPRYGMLTWQQIARHFYDGNVEKCARRLLRLRDCGLIQQNPHAGWPGVLVFPTATTYTLTNKEAMIPLTPSTASVMGATLPHLMAVNDVALQYEAKGAKGVRVLTEREIRAIEQGDKDASEIAAQIGSPGRPVTDGQGVTRYFCTPIDVSGGQVYLPDIVVVTDDRLISVEIELNAKEGSRARKILRGYAQSSPFTDVYYMTTPSVKQAMCGYWADRGQRWTDGWLQQLRILPQNTPYNQLEPAEKSRSKIKVYPLKVADESLRWYFDMVESGQQPWLTKSQWRMLRGTWAQHQSALLANGQRMPFVQWWKHIWPAVRKDAAARAAAATGGVPVPEPFQQGV